MTAMILMVAEEAGCLLGKGKKFKLEQKELGCKQEEAGVEKSETEAR